MLCDKCHEREAKVHMTKIINNEKTEMNLCEVCAQSENLSGIMPGMMMEPNWMLHNIFAELFNHASNQNLMQMSDSEPLKCDMCGFTEAQFSRVGKLGCPHCYEVFEKRLEPILKRVHGNPVHTGKIPKTADESISLRKQLTQMKDKLQEAISLEAYEMAAELRDKIREIEGKLGLEGRHASGS